MGCCRPHQGQVPAGCVIGSLSHLIRGAAVEAILDGTEKITRETLDRIGLDHTAETTRTRRKAARRRHASTG